METYLMKSFKLFIPWIEQKKITKKVYKNIMNSKSYNIEWILYL